MQKIKTLVNPISVQNCLVGYREVFVKLMDVSFCRLVVESSNVWDDVSEGTEVLLALVLERYKFGVASVLKGRGDGWVRFQLDKIVPSSRAHLRSFLCPRKVGESIYEDWVEGTLHHFHGFNESELWFDPSKAILFTYLDPVNTDAQFIVRYLEEDNRLQVGTVLRKDYIELNNLSGELALLPLNDREIYARLGEGRDIVTNFRPTGYAQYHLKQKLLKLISEHLYSTSRKVDMGSYRRQTTPRQEASSVVA